MSSTVEPSKVEAHKCRSCKGSSVSELDYTHWIFPAKPLNWSNIFCHECGLVSHYKNSGKLVTYADQEYRKKKETVYPPISLPWSTVSFKRWKHIARIVEGSINEASLSSYSILDFGGYNGLLVRALQQHWGSDCTVADLDQEGLDFAEAMGFKTINLSKHPDLFEKYNLITMVHVLEHVQDPAVSISSLVEALHDDGSVYIEVPNLFGFPLIDDAHLSTFTLDSLRYLCQTSGLEILASGYCQTPLEAIHFDYPYSTNKENVYVLARKSSRSAHKSSASFDLTPTRDINSIKHELTKNYTYRGFSISASHFRVGISKVLLSIVVFLISLLSLIPVIRRIVTSRSMYAYLKKLQNRMRDKS